MDNVLVLGNGFLGKQYNKNGFTVWGRDKLDIDPNNIEGSLDVLFTKEVCDKYDTIINCIGNANTRMCEDPLYWDVVYAINAHLPKVLSSLCEVHGMRFVQISSGCVYDQNNEPQKEDSYLSSHCRYVVSKLVGEFNCNSNDLILRPRLYFGETNDCNNLLSKITNFNTFLTEMNSYTSVQTIVEATRALLINECSGVFNVSQTGVTNLVDIAKAIGLEVVDTITGSQLREQEGLYLVNNIMDTSKLEQYYKPAPVINEIKRCWDCLNNKRRIHK
jgi:dTDP-4-dehydrorhamnose reductase